MHVLSLFDGMSAGLQALKQAEIPVEKYYASEIDKYAIQIATKNHPEIIQLGDVTKWREWDLKPGDIDLLIGGSPCQGFSFAGKQKGASTKCEKELTTLDQYLELKSNGFEFDGQSYLFWEYVNILKVLKPKYFLLENVKMTKRWIEILSAALGIEPVFINSSLISGQNRKRIYWCNWDVLIPDYKNVVLKDIWAGGVNITQRYLNKKEGTLAFSKSRGQTVTLNEKMRCQTTGGQGIANSGATNVKIGDEYFKPCEITCERAQTFPDNYTEGVSSTQRYKMLGNGWTVSVIEHIFRSMK